MNQESRKGKRSSHILLKIVFSSIIVTASIAVAALLFIFKKPAAERDVVELTPAVTVIEPEPYSGKIDIRVTGLVQPHREVRLMARAAGLITEKEDYVQPGEYVVAKTPLLQIDPKDYELQIQRLEAEVAQAEASLKELEDEVSGLQTSKQIAEKDFELQKSEYERRRGLGSAISQSELEQAQRNLNAAERSLADVSRMLSMAETRRIRLISGISLSNTMLEQARVDLERTHITAPFSGMIVSESVEKGDYVRSGDGLLVLEDTSIADISCNLRLDQLQRILEYTITDSRQVSDPTYAAYQLPPTKVTVSTRIGDELVEWEGILARYDGIGLDERTKTFPCRVEVADPVALTDGQPIALVRNMFVDVTIELDASNTDSTLLEIPEIALHPGNRIWMVVGGKLEQHAVEVLSRSINSEDPLKRQVVIRGKESEIPLGTKIVTSPLSQPNPGTEVRIVEGSPLSAQESTTTGSEEPESNQQTRADVESVDEQPVKDESGNTGLQPAGTNGKTS